MATSLINNRSSYLLSWISCLLTLNHAPLINYQNRMLQWQLVITYNIMENAHGCASVIITCYCFAPSSWVHPLHYHLVNLYHYHFTTLNYLYHLLLSLHSCLLLPTTLAAPVSELVSSHKSLESWFKLIFAFFVPCYFLLGWQIIRHKCPKVDHLLQ